MKCRGNRKIQLNPLDKPEPIEGRASGEGEGEADVGVERRACGNAPPPGRYRVRPPPLRRL